jgi:hypothetical protein
MEGILVIILVTLAFNVISSLLKRPKSEINSTIQTKSTKVDDTTIVIDKVEPYNQDEQYKRNDSSDKYIVNNYFVQNNVYAHYNPNSSSNDSSKDHSKSVWERMGYRIKYGERYAYKMYGNEIFTPEQVEKTSYERETLQLENGLTKNQKKVKQLGYALVNKVRSKRKAKDILIEEYDFDEDTAKYAVGYDGYDNWK